MHKCLLLASVILVVVLLLAETSATHRQKCTVTDCMTSKTRCLSARIPLRCTRGCPVTRRRNCAAAARCKQNRCNLRFNHCVAACLG